MNTTATGHQLAQFDNVNLSQPVMVSALEAANILFRAVADLARHQSELIAGNFTESTPSLALPALVQGLVRPFWQPPSFYHMQSGHMARSVLEPFAILSRAQQQISALQWRSPLFSFARTYP